MRHPLPQHGLKRRCKNTQEIICAWPVRGEDAACAPGSGCVCVCGDGNEDGAGTTLKRTCMCMYACTGSDTCLCPASANSGVCLCVVVLERCDGRQSNARGRKGSERGQTQT